MVWKSENNSTELGSRLTSTSDIKAFVSDLYKNVYLYVDVLIYVYSI